MPEIAPGPYVLDTHAVLALLQNEPAAPLVRALLERGLVDVKLHLSLINFGEIAYTTEREHGRKRTGEALNFIRGLPIVFEKVSETRVLAAARIKARHPLSYADAFAVALAQELAATIVTGDPEIHALREVARVLWV